MRVGRDSDMDQMLLNPETRNRISETIRRLLGAPAPMVQAAALPWRRAGDDIEVMLITSRGSGRWVLPKGWPERGETLWQTAQREAAEEAGVDGPISHMEAGVYFYGKVHATGLERRCEVHVFALEAARIADEWPERGQRERVWVPRRQAAGMVDEPDLAEIVNEFSDNPRENHA